MLHLIKRLDATFPEEVTKMESLVFALSFIPIVVSASFLSYLLAHKNANRQTFALVGVMTLVGAAFVIFIKYYFSWASDVNLSDIISSSLGVIVLLVVLIISTGTRNGRYSIRNIFPTIKSFNFPTIALLLYVGAINLILFLAHVAKYGV